MGTVVFGIASRFFAADLQFVEMGLFCAFLGILIWVRFIQVFLKVCSIRAFLSLYCDIAFQGYCERSVLMKRDGLDRLQK